MAQQPTVIPQEMIQPHPGAMHPPINSYYPENTNDLTGGLPINLDSLRDGPPGSKPFYPYSTLIRYAIKGAPNQKLLLEDIYYAIESRFPYFRNAPPGWKNSVRHNLSLNPCFEKVPRPLTDRGKGSYWTVNDNVDPRTGVHRVRKKKTKGTKGQQQAAQAALEEDVDYHPPEATFQETQFVQQQPMGPAAAEQSRQPQQQQPQQQQPYPPYPPPFDPTFGMMAPGMRFVQPPFFSAEELEADEHGNVDWNLAWRKELNSLQQLTEEQEKAGADPEWYRMMLFRLRESAHQMHAREIVFEPFDAQYARLNDPTSEPVLLRARKETLEPNAKWVLYSYLKPESVRVHPEATVRPWATCQVVGDALSFASALGYVRRSQIYKRGYVFRRGPLVIQMFQQEIVDERTQKPVSAHQDTLWEVEVKTANPIRNTQETPLSKSIEAVLEVQLLMKGLLDLRRQDV
ncbi:hypothetical protein EIP91_001526 [Steccherinum ochraceum]|uniref:Mediator of RNA polymerase II transcription subunit 18 n=1 Tax=Steccherinum ochraceum TaxID=92696 RepID=A0A4R0RSJ1_9APHY|nr:hypothetical protein EIP91_001526 [Steccherinum ochraceum]